MYKIIQLIRKISSRFGLKMGNLYPGEIYVSRSDDDKVTIKKSGENDRFNGARVISTRFSSACFHHQNRSISSLRNFRISLRKIDRENTSFFMNDLKFLQSKKEKKK